MKSYFYIILSLCLLTVSNSTTAQQATEKDLIHEILISLQTGDDSAYASLFPTYKLMADAAYTFQPDSSQMERSIQLRNNIRNTRDFDPEMNPKIIDMMNFVRLKGSDSGVHWGDILIAKFELDKQRLPRELIGFELIAPIRMQGYIFIRDMLTRRRYGIAVRDIFLINDKWYGGTLLNILEASSAAEYEESLAIEAKELEFLMRAKQLGMLDSILAARDSIRKGELYPGMFSDEEEEEDESLTIYKDIAARKFYTGYFDKTISVELYMRGIKGACPETICTWEAMYRFGDLDEYVMLEVEVRPDGTFVLSEEELGIMELKLQGTTFTGTWTSVRDKTEYEAYIKEKVELRDRKLFKLDKTFEELLWQ